MTFPTVTFAIFLVVVMAGSWLLRPHPRAWRSALLVASWVFYASMDWRFVVLLAAMIGGTHLVATAMARWPRAQKRWLFVGITADLIILGFFKYFGFFVTSLSALVEPFGLDPQIPLFEVILPIGISFYVFESIAYLIEVHRSVVEPMSLLDLAVYLSFFPKLVSGPITRASEFHPQLARPMPADQVDGSTALWLMGRGLFKKLVIASFLATAITDGVFATPVLYSSLEVLAGIYGYAALIYVDFSAYTDMARGIAMLLGFVLPENFRGPYTATSVREFWSRWHMTLSRWVRDFLFQPLFLRHSGSRFGRLSSIVLVMLLVGLWHGAAWTFVLWGGVHGVALAWERFGRERRRGQGRPPVVMTGWGGFWRRFWTFQFVAFAWVFFQADSVSAALDVFARLGSFGPAPAVTPLLVLVLIGVFAAQYFPEAWASRVRAGFRRVGPVLQIGVLGALLLVVDALGPEGVPPFIYSRF